MARYIDADKFRSDLWSSLKGYRKVPEICAVKNCIVELDEQPTADVVEVKHGHWKKRIFIIFDSEKVGYQCSECNTTWDTNTNYCPYCGAKMDGEGDTDGKRI